MADPMTKHEAEQHLRELAGRAEDIIGTHIRGITFGHDDLRRLVGAIRTLLGQAGEKAGSPGERRV
jgi:hypothetical protein